jgi:hypothetical protein
MDRLSSSQTRTVLQVEALEERCVPSTAEYVAGLYSAILHRSPAPAEVSGWVDRLNAGATPLEVAQAFTTSSEYATNEIRADYNVFLGRQPAPAEVAGWLQPLQAAAGEKQVEAGFLASEEFFSRQGGSALSWLNGVYKGVLGRAPDPAGLNLWSQLLQAGTSRAAVALAIVNSPEADSRLVSAAYLNLLGRNADLSGVAGWVAQLQQGLSPSNLAARIASSDEFIQLKAHGVLDASSPPSLPAPAPAPAEVPVDLPITAPCLGDGTDTTDQASCDGSSADQGSDGSAFSPSADGSAFDTGTDKSAFNPGTDNSGFDPGSDCSGFDPGSDGGGSDGGDVGADSY